MIDRQQRQQERGRKNWFMKSR